MSVELYAIVTVIVTAVWGYIKLLQSSNKEKDTQISNLNTETKILNDNASKEVFDATQKIKADAVTDETTIDAIDKERGNVKIDDSQFTTVTV
jgi:hypothetical protein